MKLTALSIFILLLTTSTFGQKAKIDSVQLLLKFDKNDSIKVEHLNYIATIYSNQKRFKDAEKYFLNSLALAKNMGSLNSIASVHLIMAKFYNISGKPTKELEHFKEYILFRDSIVNNEKNVASNIQFEKEIKSANERTLKYQFITFGAVALILVLFYLTFRFLSKLLSARNKNKQLIVDLPAFQKRNEELKIKKEELEILTNQQNNLIEQQKHTIEKYLPITNIEEEHSRKKIELDNITSEYDANIIKNQKLQKELSYLEERLDNLDYGFYKPHYSFKTSTEYKIEIEKITDNLKEMIKSNDAIVSKIEWSLGESKAEGKKMMKQIGKLMLRAFNGESDVAIAKVSWNNIVTMEARINRAFESINNFSETVQMTISEKYKELKLKELYLTFELEEKIYKEKEEQRKIKEQMREEEKAQREMENEIKEAEEEEKRNRKALENAKLEIQQAQGKELEMLNEKIRIYEERLQNAHENKERAISRAQLTKSGYVYIISNIGSFGEDVYKIGMTRRLDPQDRIDELGDASVPFDFDVHGFIYSENAPALENQLHTHFELRRVNRVNYRTEFFKVNIDEIEVAVKGLNLKIELTKLAIAKEYRETISLLNQIKQSNGEEKSEANKN
jgi:hypothetical protein